MKDSVYSEKDGAYLLFMMLKIEKYEYYPHILMKIDDFHFLSVSGDENELSIWNKDLVEIE